MKTLKKIFAVLFVTAIAATAGCKKDNGPSGYMAMQMTEARTSGSTSPCNAWTCTKYTECSMLGIKDKTTCVKRVSLFVHA